MEKEEYMFRKVTESMPDTMLLVNGDCLIEEIMGNSEGIGLTSAALNQRIDNVPGYQYPGKIGRRIVTFLQDCIQKQEEVTTELPIRRANGTFLYLQVKLIPLESGKVLISLVDQTVLVEKEKENRKLTVRFNERHSMMEMALRQSKTTAYSFNFERFNRCDRENCQRCFQFYGAKNELLDRNKYICRALTVLKHPEDRRDFFYLFNTIRNQHVGEAKVTFKLKNNAGEYRQYEVFGKAQEYDEGGNANLIIGSISDYQEHFDYERSLIRAKEKAENADQMKSAFLANMTHEIRTPLHAIVGFSDLLGVETDPEMREEYLNVIKANNEVLSGLINDVLDISKIEANMMIFSYISLNIPLWMQEVYNTIRLRMPEGVELIMEQGPAVTIDIDKNRLTQVMTNLLTNAIKHTTEGSITFGYTIENDFVSFYIKDTGEGIPEDKIEHIFSRFIQLKGAKQGIGLGLAICKGLVTKMGGEISAESTEGSGSTFKFSLPIRKK
ncbi:HAMP domain-containing histidine kinase [Parabacteroides sp. OttesenSCG-928-G07]|nr:HAMP domain-containing histidine kinase [Parabacteroides sp. OttesenSCG-928-G21]MDL2277562.1 HAMP domain-containing histidine kinase [Parabacteroides sp. OttesenSCG-928-G07]